MPIAELATDVIYAYSFICTNLDVTTPAKAAAVEHWYRHRTSIENINWGQWRGRRRAAAPALCYHEVNTTWMWGVLLAVNIAGWLQQLTRIPARLIQGATALAYAAQESAAAPSAPGDFESPLLRDFIDGSADPAAARSEIAGLYSTTRILELGDVA